MSKVIKQEALLDYLINMKKLVAEDMLNEEEGSLDEARLMGIYETYLHLVEKFDVSGEE